MLCGLILLGLAAQVASFTLHPVPGNREIAATKLPPHYPPDYTAADYARAAALDEALFWGNLATTATTVCVLSGLLLSGIVEQLGAASATTARAWLIRILFLVALYIGLCVIGFPFRYCRFLHYRAFGLSELTVLGWLKLFLLGLPVPLALFALKYLLVICTLPLCKRLWWLAASVGVFLVFDATPEIVSRTYPADPIENVQVLAAGPHSDSMKFTLRKAGLDLPLMVVDESRRSKTANICLTGRRGREYVLLTDTFVQEYAPQQVSLALAHELGHFQRKGIVLLVHLGTALLLSLLTFGFVFVLTGLQALPVSSAPRIVVLTMLCALAVGQTFAPVSLALSRREERLADHHALQLGGNRAEYQRLLLRVAQHELTPLDLPPWRYYLCASHPTFLERIRAAGSE